MPLDPISAITTGAGLVQSIVGGIQAHRAQKKLDKLINSYQPNASILDYYNKALAKYNVNPYTSSLYTNAMRGAGRGLTTGISTLNDRRSVLGGINRLVDTYNNASLRASAAAEGQQSQSLSQLGSATQMKAAEDFKPFEMKYNLLASKAGGGKQLVSAGLTNAFGGLSAMNQLALLKQLYGDDSGTGVSSATGYNPNVGVNTTGAIQSRAKRRY